MENDKETNPKTGSKDPSKKSAFNSYWKYSAIAFQMGAIIGGGVWLGSWLDEKYHTSTPWFTLGIGLFSIFAALYLTLKDLLRSK